jgi:hypothetical protein
MTIVYVRSVVVKLGKLVIEMSGCRLGCTKVMPECMYNCLSNPGKPISLSELVQRVKDEKLIGIDVRGSFHQKTELMRQFNEHK